MTPVSISRDALEKALQDRFVIWSNEHGAWWRPRSAGYTPSVWSAGLYDEAEAKAICHAHDPSRKDEEYSPAADELRDALAELSDDTLLRAALTAETKTAGREEIAKAIYGATFRHFAGDGLWEVALASERMVVLKQADAVLSLLPAQAEEWRPKAVRLWALLDDIDTADDVAKSDDGAFRRIAQAAQRRRHDILSGDEWEAASREEDATPVEQLIIDGGKP